MLREIELWGFTGPISRPICIALRILAVVAVLSAGAAHVGAQSLAVPVYRFVNVNTGGHFFTISETERNDTIQNKPWFRDEGIGFNAYSTQQPGTLPIHRFYNTTGQGYFYTIYESEKDYVVQNLPAFTYEGVVFYAYPTAQPETLPIYRFQNTRASAHFFTIYENEKDTVIQSYDWFLFEGVSFYAYLRSVDSCVNAASKWALWTGATCLRGANVYQIHDLSSGAPGTFYPRYTQTDFNNLAALGANVVNISHPGLYSETAPYALNTDAQANLDSLLAMIQEANMFAVITFRTGPGRNEAAIVSELDFPALYSVWTSQAEQDAWVAMWKYTADRYRNNAIVVGYDLMCEPHSNAILAIPTYDPSDFYPAYADTLYDWNPLAKRITTAIRQVDTNTPILIGGMSWSGASWLDSLTSNGDSKTVYMVHQYEPQTEYTHQSAPYANTYGTLAGTFTRDNLQTYFAYISSFKSSRGVPVAVNEFGVQRYQPNADQYLTDSMDIMESNGLNYSIWLWESSDPNVDYDDFNFRRGTDPANHVDVSPNVLTTVVQKYFQKNTVHPSNRGF